MSFFERRLPSPEVTEQDTRHIAAFAEFSQLLRKSVMDPVDLGIAIAIVFDATVRPYQDNYEDIRAQIDHWTDEFAFDSVSTRYGDRATNVIDDSNPDEETFSDPDGSGARSAKQKRAGMIHELGLFLATSPDSMLSSYARGSVLRGTANQMATYRGLGIHQAAIQLEADMWQQAGLYRDTGDYGNMIRVLGAMRAAGYASEEKELEFVPAITDVPNN